MPTEETKNNETKAKGADFGCCGPENFKKMFAMMSKYCPGQDDTTGFSAMKKDMMKNMMEMCCGPKTTATKEDTQLQKEPKKEAESTEKERCD